MARILYLSMSREEYSPNYFPFLRSYIERVKSPETEVDLVGTRVGRIDSFRFFETLDWISILDSVIGAEQDGYDAVAIGNILDPALREARSMVDIPVLGLGETSMLTSCMMGSTFSLVGVNPYFGGRFEENVAKYGLRERLASIECMGLTPHELDECFSDEVGRAKAIDSFVAAARASLEKGAEVIVPAGGRLTAFLNAVGLREVDGAPLLDGTVSLVAATEAAIRIRRQSGSFVSRRRLYARAPQASILQAGAEYADGYNLPALRRLVDGAHDDASNPEGN
jgi:allantoin racemase